MDQRKDTGNFGERLATMMLMRSGMRIRGRQVRTPYGEIDIVAESGKELLFFEVKTRTGNRFGVPEESITKTKREHLARSVEHYRQTENLMDRPFRVHAIAIELDPATRKAKVRQIEDILAD